MNDLPEQLDWPEPVQDEISPEDLTMIVWEMKKDPNYEAGRARRIAALKEIFGLWSERTDIPKDGLEYQRMMRKEWE